MKKRMYLIVLALLCVISLAACGGSNPETDIIGTWVCLDDSQPHEWVCTLTFEAGGRFIDRDGDAGTFTIDGDTLTLAFDEFDDFEVTFRLRGNRLTLEEGDDLSVMLTRQ